MNSKLQAKWTSHLKAGKEKEDFEAYIRNSTGLLERLTDIVRERKQEFKLKESDYDSPSWAYKCADRQGYNRALDDILKFIDLKGE